MADSGVVLYNSDASNELSIHHSKLGQALSNHGGNVAGLAAATDGGWDGPAAQAFQAFAKAFQQWCAEGQRTMDSISQGHQTMGETYQNAGNWGAQSLSS